MHRKIFIRNLLLTAAVPSILLSACGSNDVQSTTEVAQTYTCPMHPQVVQHQEGTCPICGMGLVPFDKTNKDKFLTLSKDQQLLANVSTIVVGKTSMANQAYLNGKLTVNPEQTEYVSSRIGGRIDVLYAKETGVVIKQGQALFKIYSEELLSLQQEYLLMEEQATHFPTDKRFRELADASRAKLILYGQTASQVKRLRDQKATEPYITYTAPASGTVSEMMIVEGQYVSEGQVLMKLENYQSLWVEGDVYAYEATGLQGKHVKVVLPGWEDRPLDMKIDFVAPAMASSSQIVKIRGSIENKGDWQPGLQAQILMPTAADGEKLTLPIDAVIRDGKTEHVWVQVSEGKFEPRRVEIGDESSDRVAIRSGINKGDKVVITGAYLLYSEYVLKKGAHPLASI